jgi:hypothetical protein
MELAGEGLMAKASKLIEVNEASRKAASGE